MPSGSQQGLNVNEADTVRKGMATVAAEDGATSGQAATVGPDGELAFADAASFNGGTITEPLVIESADPVDPALLVQDGWGVAPAGQEILSDTPEVADEDVATGQRVQWYDGDSSVLLFKQRDNLGVLHTGRSAALPYTEVIQDLDLDVSNGFRQDPNLDIGGMGFVALYLTLTAFDPDGETVGQNDGEIWVNFGNPEQSIDNVNWNPYSPFHYFGTSSGLLVGDVGGVVAFVPRYARMVLDIEMLSGFSPGTYAGSNEPSATVRLQYRVLAFGRSFS